MDVIEPSTSSAVHPESDAARDVAAIDSSAWPKRELENCAGLREPRFQVIYKQSVLDEIRMHGQGAKDIEICGVLVGTGYRDAMGPYLLVEHCIRGNKAASRSTNVTFTADTWQHIQLAMDRDHPDRQILGWYHTHPGFGIFLSDMDVFICANFFNLPWQIALVYDPHSGDEGTFVWREGRPENYPVLVENDVTPTASGVPLISRREAIGGASDEVIVELLSRIRHLERQQTIMFYLLAFFSVFVTVWAVEFSPITPPAPPTAKPAIGAAHDPGQVPTITKEADASKPSGH